MKKLMRFPTSLGALLLACTACGDSDISDNPGADGGGADAGDRLDGGAGDDDLYAFESRFGEGSSVSYAGQTLRHVLISDMKGYLGTLTGRVDTGNVPDDIVADLRFYYEFADDGTGGEILLSFDAPLDQTTYGDISGAKSLQGKIAGQDEKGQHADWTTDFVGWPGAASPDNLVGEWFDAIADLAAERQSLDPPVDPDGAQIELVFVGPDGRDYQQLLQKFLLMAITFSQASDDYLDSDLEDHGLNVDNVRDDDASYTALEHHWDEAFGYFGAARSYKRVSDDDIVSMGYDDYDDSGTIDLASEVHFGASVNAAKRDRGSVAGSETDFTADAIEAFLEGRTIIAEAGETLTEDEKEDLLDARDRAITAWEKAIAATVVHYINEVVADMDAFDTEDYDFERHAKHWSELKGFALGFQFNPRSPLTGDDFAELHGLVGTAPVLEDALEEDQSDYRSDLLEARDILADAYGFDEDNVMAW